ncbi:MAG: hypothetical protein WDA16_06205 [Candidatus Thermoplasmatota archaeon]
MLKESLMALALVAAIVVFSGSASAGIDGTSPLGGKCNGVVDSNCECTTNNNGCIETETCGAWVTDYCYVG